MLAKSKLNSNETLISQVLIDMEISHEEFVTILKEKDKYGKMKKNLRGENENYEIKQYKIKDLSEKQSEMIKHFMSSKKIFLCVYV